MPHVDTRYPHFKTQSNVYVLPHDEQSRHYSQSLFQIKTGSHHSLFNGHDWKLASPVSLPFRAPACSVLSARPSHSRSRKGADKCDPLPEAGGRCSQQPLQYNLGTSPGLQCRQGRGSRWGSENTHLTDKMPEG